MTQLELKNHQVWRYLTEILEHFDANALVREHLEECDYKICGYWDEEDIYYEEIILPRTLESELVSSSIGITQKKRFLQFKFVLKAFAVDAIDQVRNNVQKIADLVLVYNENLEFVDENWLLDIDSPLLDVKRNH
ncbi:MAG: hypothetical protein KME60_28840 [Cyanomargarita calcarea GSE-NOS-MK-12-04C]|jgi:hypothetical protein|uniref:Uncharacterized protein n=1 Tax=Cyanomargarita calcarea GSE-NOS-MK-12-04C TaxID=2839659 RepID=A0A951UW23_9CYAN|nr:hypothetical protein [Cyanomargarita calcarea GSE-NOS-MK-12-04C]